MRRLIVLAGVAVLGLSNVGCILNQYPSDPTQRMDVLMNQSENLRQAGEYRSRRWNRISGCHAVNCPGMLLDRRFLKDGGVRCCGSGAR